MMLSTATNRQGNCSVDYCVNWETFNTWYEVTCFSHDDGMMQFRYKTLKAAYNKFTALCNKYHIE